MPSPTPVYRVGPGDFQTDTARLEHAVSHFDEGKGLIGGDPERRPHWLHPLPPEPAPAFRLLQSSPDHLERLHRFFAQAPLEIEIGSGRGEFILDWAAQHPDRHFLAFEVKWKLMMRIAERAERRGLRNLWVSDDDARYDLPRLLAPGKVEVFHILFPDPWWKSKHQARRLFVPPFVRILASLLRPGGILRIATDVPDYAEHIRALIGDEPTLNLHQADLTEQVAERFALATPTSRQVFCDEIGRPYQFFHFVRNQDETCDPDR